MSLIIKKIRTNCVSILSEVLKTRLCLIIKAHLLQVEIAEMDEIHGFVLINHYMHIFNIARIYMDDM